MLIRDYCNTLSDIQMYFNGTYFLSGDKVLAVHQSPNSDIVASSINSGIPVPFNENDIYDLEITKAFPQRGYYKIGTNIFYAFIFYDRGYKKALCSEYLNLFKVSKVGDQMLHDRVRTQLNIYEYLLKLKCYPLLKYGDSVWLQGKKVISSVSRISKYLEDNYCLEMH